MKVLKITSFVILLVLFFASCGNDDENMNPDDTPTIPMTEEDFFIAKIDGMDVYYEADTDNILGFVGTSLQAVGYPDTSTVSFNSSLNYYTPGGDIDPIFLIEKGTLRFAPAPTPTNEIFKNFLDIGDYSFSQNAEAGFNISWYDEDGEEWSTSLGSAAQGGSSVSIDEINEVTQLYTYYIVATISFSCTLYNEAGQSKQLTNGLYRGAFGNI